MDYNTGYQYSATGSGVEPVGGNLSVDNRFYKCNNKWSDLIMDRSNVHTSFQQTTPGAAFQFTETYSGPGLSNHTIIQRETEVTSITDTTSIFQQ